MVSGKTSGAQWELPWKIKKTLEFWEFQQYISNNISSSNKLLFRQSKTKTLLWDKNIFLDYVQALHLPKFKVMPEGEQSTFGTSAETRRTMSLAIVKEEECSNLSLLFGVRKHRRSDEKQPKARGERFSFSSMRPPQWLKRGGAEKGGRAVKKTQKEWIKTEDGLAGVFGFLFFFPPFPICNGFCSDIKTKKREMGSKSLSSFAGGRKHHWHLSFR